MRYRKLIVVFISSLIVLLAAAAIARADAPTGRTKLGDHLNLNALDKANNQAGFTLFGQDDPQSDQENAGEDGDGDGDGSETLAEHPVAAAMAAYFSEEYELSVTHEEVMELHEMGYGFGTITKAYFLSQMLEDKPTPMDLLGEAEENGWGNVLKGKGVQPGSVHSVGKVMGNQPDHAGPPDHAGKKPGSGPELEQGNLSGGLSGPGNSGNAGNGQGKENGNGKAKGKNK